MQTPTSTLARALTRRTIEAIESEAASPAGVPAAFECNVDLGRNRIAAQRNVARLSRALTPKRPHALHSSSRHCALTALSFGPTGTTMRGDLGDSSLRGVRSAVYGMVCGKRFAGAACATVLSVDRHAMERFFDRSKSRHRDAGAAIADLRTALAEAAENAALILASFLDPSLQAALREDGPMPILLPAGGGALLGVIRQMADRDSGWDGGSVEAATWLNEDRLCGDQASVAAAVRQLPAEAARGPGHLARHVALIVEQTPAASRGNTRTARMGPSVHVTGGTAALSGVGAALCALHARVVGMEDAVDLLGPIPKSPRILARYGGDIARSRMANERPTVEEMAVEFA